MAGDSGDGARAHLHPDDMMVQLFTNMLRNIVGDTSDGEGSDATSGARSPRAAGAGQGQTAGTGNTHSSTHAYTPMPSVFGSSPPVIRWPYDSNARLNPRDADSPQPHEEAVLDLPTHVFPIVLPYYVF